MDKDSKGRRKLEVLVAVSVVAAVALLVVVVCLARKGTL